MRLIDKDILLGEVNRLKLDALQKKSQCKKSGLAKIVRQIGAYNKIISLIDTLEVKEVNVWKTVDNINPPQADRNKIYCVLTKNKLSEDKYLTARVVNHPQDEDLLQWCCTEFPFRCYDMCEGDKYMQIV